VPGGWAAQRYGGRATLIASFVLWASASLATPQSAAAGGALTLARVAIGVAQGFIIPSIHTVLSQVRCLALMHWASVLGRW
jgi:ACS family sodium-dependent inorganic phosphate cotransporter